MAALTVFIVLLAVVSSYAFECPQSADCFCSQGAEHIVITCPKSPVTEHLIIRFQPGDFVRFQCNYERNDTEYFRYARGMGFGPVKHAIFLSCNLPDASFAELFRDAGISNVQTLQFMSYKNLGDRLQPNHFTGLNLTYLSLDGNQFRAFPPTLFDSMEHLRSLSLRLNQLHFPPDYAFQLPLLEYLELGDNKLEALPRNIFWNLTRLDTLNLERNSFTTLHREWFQGMPNLTTLELQDNQIRTLPEDVFQDLPNLRRIRLFQNDLQAIPDRLFANNTRLETLNVIGNMRQLGILPPGMLQGLHNLTSLSLNRSGISEIPEKFLLDCTSLQILSLQANTLPDIPEDTFRNTTEMIELDLSYNQLKFLPQKVFQTMSKLRSLSLQHNLLSNLTSNLFLNLRNLNSLHLQGNRISYIAPDAFPNLAALTYLDLSDNKLNFSNGVRESVFNNCQHLKVLKLRNNLVDSIATQWSLTLLQLTELDLRNNSIQSVTNYDMNNFLAKDVCILLQGNQIQTVAIEPQIDVVHITGDGPPQRNISVYLDYNPLYCNCSVLEFIHLLKSDFGAGFKKDISLVVDNLRCSGPATLSQRRVRNVDVSELLCSAPNGCPENCTCELQPSSYALIINCTGAGYLQFPNLPDPSQYTRMVDGHYRKLNHTIMDMTGNYLRYLDRPLLGYDNVTEMHLSHNNITRILPEAIPPKVHALYLDSNNLTILPADLVQRMGNITNFHVSLSNNPWICDCEAVPLQKFLQDSYRSVVDGNAVQCDRNGRQVSTLTIDELCPGQTKMIVAASVTLTAIALVVTALSVAYYRNKHLVQVWLYSRNLCLWCVTERELDRDKSYDAFVSYSHKDEEFVIAELVSKLETEQPKFKLCVHYRDWLAGEFIPNQIVNSVESSRRTIVVLSKNFLESVWGRMEFKAAHLQALQDKTRRVIIIVYGEVPSSDELDEELRAYVSMNTYLKWDDPWFWQKLRYAMPHPPTPGAFGRRKDDKLELIRAEILNNRSPRTSTSTA